MHEFNLIEDGERALMITHQSYYHQFSNGVGYTNTGPLRSVGNPGFVEVEVATGNILFEWWSLGHISPIESDHKAPAKPESTWDWA